MINKILNFLGVKVKHVPVIDENTIRFSASDSISKYMNQSEDQARACIDFLCMFYDGDFHSKWFHKNLTIYEYEYKGRVFLIITETKRGRRPKILPMPHIIFLEELETI